MEQATVTFNSITTGNTITISLDYNKEKSTVDYKINLSDGMNPEDSQEFITFLASMFLSGLQSNDTSKNSASNNSLDDTIDDTPVENTIDDDPSDNYVKVSAN